MASSYLLSLNRVKPVIFHLKCISPEYFDDLLLLSNYKTHFHGDIKSCALLSLNSLAALSATSKSWIKLYLFDDEECFQNCNSEFEDKSKKKKFSLCTNLLNKDECSYLIQCFATSSIQKDYVLYVTPEKFFNVMQHFDIGLVEKSICTVVADKSKIERIPEIARNIIVASIGSGTGNRIYNLQLLLNKYFEVPKHLKDNEVFRVRVKDNLPSCYFPDYSYVEDMYFVVVSIEADQKTKDRGRNEFGYYIFEERTLVFLASEVQGFLPPVYTKYVRLKDQLGYEISLCPGGLDKYYENLHSLFTIFLSKRDAKLRPAILLTGAAGSGKKTVLKCVSLSLGLKLTVIDCFDFIGIECSTLTKALNDITLEVGKLRPCVLLLENVEFLGRDVQNRENVSITETFQKHIVKMCQELLDLPVIVVACTNKKATDLMPSVEKMFIQTISFDVLKGNEAYNLVNWLVHEHGMACFPEVMKKISEKLNGYLFTDVVKLLRLALKFHREDETVKEERSLLLKKVHLDKGIQIMEEHYADSIGSAKVPTVHWDDIGGLTDLKEEIINALNMPLKYPQLWASGLRLSGFLFYGPPGTGKTLMAKAIATECNLNFLSVKGPELINMYVGQSEENIREIFQRARDASPCIIFFDELDSLAPSRGDDSGSVTNRIVSQLLTEMDGLQSKNGTFIVGATNRPDLVDPALLRPGRFDKLFYVGVCEDSNAKLNVIKALTKRFSLSHDVNLESVVSALPKQVTGADIYSICSNAWLEAARRTIYDKDEEREIKLPLTVVSSDFQRALKEFVPSLTPDVIKYYESFRSWGK